MKRNNIFKWLIIVIFTLVGFQSEAQDMGNIQINKFDLILKNNKVYINWSTDSTATINYFEIERSDDGEKFKTFAYVLGEDPTKEGKQFGYFDTVLNNSGNAWYRLKHVDQNGELQYSSVKMISL